MLPVSLGADDLFESYSSPRSLGYSSTDSEPSPGGNKDNHLLHENNQERPVRTFVIKTNSHNQLCSIKRPVC